MKRPKGGHTPKQYAYAQLKLTGGGRSKNEMARLAGFSPSVANNIKYKVENTEGFHNAMFELARSSHNLLLGIFHEFESRGLEKLDNKELISATNAIASAWDRIEARRAPAKTKNPDENPLRKIVLQQVENQTVNIAQPSESPVEIIKDTTSSPVPPVPPTSDEDF